MLDKIKESVFFRMVFWYTLAIAAFLITIFNPLISPWSAQFINIEQLPLLYKIPVIAFLALMLLGSFLAAVFCGVGGAINHLCLYLSEFDAMEKEVENGLAVKN